MVPRLNQLKAQVNLKMKENNENHSKTAKTMVVYFCYQQKLIVKFTNSASVSSANQLSKPK